MSQETLRLATLAMHDMLNVRQVAAMTSMSKSSIYRLVGEGLFPRPHKVGKRAVRWQRATIVTFLASRAPAAQDTK